MKIINFCSHSSEISKGEGNLVWIKSHNLPSAQISTKDKGNCKMLELKILNNIAFITRKLNGRLELESNPARGKQKALKPPD